LKILVTEGYAFPRFSVILRKIEMIVEQMLEGYSMLSEELGHQKSALISPKSLIIFEPVKC